jgi:asparagine synthase (glutamine-hydrolysing)
MSGIAGLLRLDAQSIHEDDLAPLASAIRHRGRDGGATWLGGSIGLAHAALRTTPEAMTETQPLTSGSLTIVADIRLDNRDELLPALGLRDAAIGDAELALRAYAAWGTSCADRLEGDFAFAIWDGSARSLFAARDAFGVKPFVYAMLPGKLFVFASEAQAVLACAEIPRGIDDQRVADCLALRFRDPGRTFYRSVSRLPGGCTLSVAGSRTTIDRFWSIERVEPRRDRGRGRDERFAEEYRHHFARAVHARMRGPRPSAVGAMMSGGLDSTAVACVARDARRGARLEPLPVFSCRFSDCPEADEREYQDVVFAAGGLQPTTIDSAAGGVSPWDDFEALLANGPLIAPSHYLIGVMARRASEAGVQILLDGLGGDFVVSTGQARYLELMLHGRLPALIHELRAASRHTGSSTARLFAGYVIGPVLPWWARAGWRRLRGRPIEPAAPPFVRPRILNLVDRDRPPTAYSTRHEHLIALTSPLVADGVEVADRMMSRHGSEARYPFFDRRLAEFCVSLPGDQKLADGYSRIVARRAMAGIVPEAVRWRTSKGRPGLHFISAIRRERGRLDDLFVRDPSALEPYVDVESLRRQYEAFLAGRATLQAAIQLWTAAALGYWLRRL